jgi:hypothetical protein
VERRSFHQVNGDVFFLRHLLNPVYFTMHVKRE